MRKVILWDMVTVDGFFEGSGHDLGWFVFEEELERYILETQQEAATLLFGRVTYEMMAAYWPTATGRIADFMNGIEKVVFSRTMTDPGWNNARVENDIAKTVSVLKEGEGGDIFVFGSADFAGELIRADLVDEYRIGINPVVLGEGIRFFKGGEPRRSLRLLEVRPLRSGVVILHYAPQR
ncbi:MAG TPA: dihydrofolate reductase family protein [Rhizobiaceae bacterium]|nr:dihydrofolate reductase family protein [Rhizobiaceae bacterium]